MGRRSIPTIGRGSRQVLGDKSSDSPRRAKPVPARKLSLKSGSKEGRVARDEKPGISILLIDDNRLFRMGLSALLKKQEGLKLLAASADPEQAKQQGRGRNPDVILLDLGLGDRASLQVVKGMRAAYPETRLIVMGMIPVRSETLALVKEGVSGFVLKDATISEFVASIRAVAAGRRVLPSSLTESLFDQIVEDASQRRTLSIADVKMTTREREIADLIVDGLSNKEIGKALSIATDTVKSHVHNILEKLSLRSRVEVAIRGRAPAAAH